jgi:uncharacterized protein
MKVEGVRELPADRQRVWSLLMDPAVLTRCIPGCERLEPTGENSYKAVLKIGIAAIRGSYNGTVTMSDLNPPKSYKLTVEGKGTPGFVRGVASVTLSEEAGSTDFRYSADVQVGGLIASVGQRMLQGMATTLLHQFFECLNREVRSSAST